ncbi:type I restriction-modification system,specificity subunit S [groundwater metagenome]
MENNGCQHYNQDHTGHNAKRRWRNWAADPEGITGEELLDFVNNELFKSLKNLHAQSDRRGLVVREVFEDAYNYMKSGTLMRQVINKINEIDFNISEDRHLFGDIYEQILHDNTLARPLRDYGSADRVDVIVTNPPFGGMEEDGIESNFPAAYRTRETADLFLLLIMHLLKEGGRSAIILPDGTLFGEGVKTHIKEKLLAARAPGEFAEGWRRISDNFDLLYDAPENVGALRQAILQLAVMGKLVAQDTNDEPASVLMEKINAEKERLIKGKKINNVRALPTIDEDEVPYNLPEGWNWVRLGDVCHDWGQKKPDVEFTYIDVSAIDKEHGIISEDVKILKPNEAPSRARKIVSKGTVIYATVRPYLLNIAIVDKEIEPEPIVSTAFAVLHPLSGVLNRYLYYYLRSKPFIAYVESEMTGMAYPAINDGKLYLGLVPLPPSNEQRRIVAKLDQLMSLV